MQSFFDHLLAGEVVGDVRHAAGGENGTLPGVEGQGFFECGGEVVRIVWLDQPAGVAALDGFACAAVVGGDDGTAHGLCFCGDTAKAFGVGGGRDDDGGQHVGGGHVVAVVDNADPAAEVFGADGVLEFLAVVFAALVCADHDAEDVGSIQFFHGVDQDVVAFPAGQAARQHDDVGAVGDAPLFFQDDEALGGDSCGVKAFQRDAAGDDFDSLGREVVVFLQVGGDEFGDGDDDFALGDRAVVDFFGLAADVVGGVAGCDEACFCVPAGAPCAPGGGAAAGVDDAGVIFFDQFFDPFDVLPHDERVFAVDREVFVNGADAGEFGDAQSAVGHDDGATSCLDDTCGDVDAALFSATGAEFRDNLDDREFGSLCFGHNKFFPAFAGNGVPDTL